MKFKNQASLRSVRRGVKSGEIAGVNFVKSSRLSAGSFASERAFALMWQGIDSIVIEVELSDKFYRKGMRIEPGLECSQFELLEGVVIPPDELRRVSEEELIEDRKYLKSLNRSKRSPHVRTEF